MKAHTWQNNEDEYSVLNGFAIRVESFELKGSELAVRSRGLVHHADLRAIEREHIHLGTRLRLGSEH